MNAATCTCRPPYLHVAGTPRQVRCHQHYWTVPAEYATPRRLEVAK